MPLYRVPSAAARSTAAREGPGIPCRCCPGGNQSQQAAAPLSAGHDQRRMVSLRAAAAASCVAGRQGRPPAGVPRVRSPVL